MKQIRNIAVLAALLAIGGVYYSLNESPDPPGEQGSAPNQPVAQDPDDSPTVRESGEESSEEQRAAVAEYEYGRDQSNTQGNYIRYTLTRACVAGYADTLSGEQWPMDDCEDTILSTDHPYGSYTIEQLEYAANVMKDADAAYVLGLRFAWEPAHDRRRDAHRYLFGAFLMGAPESVFEDIIQEQGYTSALLYRNGELDRDHFASSYIMNRVGEHFGAIENRTTFFRELAGDAEVDFDQLEEDALALFNDLNARRAAL